MESGLQTVNDGMMQDADMPSQLAMQDARAYCFGPDMAQRIERARRIRYSAAKLAAKAGEFSTARAIMAEMRQEAQEAGDTIAATFCGWMIDSWNATSGKHITETYNQKWGF